MNCHDFEMNIFALIRRRLIDASTRELIASHADNCVSCATRLAEERALTDGVQLVLAEIKAEEAPARIEKVLLEAFREQFAGPGPEIVQTPMSTRLWGNWKHGLVAAVVLILISVLSQRWLGSDSNLLHQTAIVPSTPVPVSEQPTPSINSDHALPQENVVLTPRRVRRHLPRKISHSEEVTEFIPLIEGEDLSSFESLQVARVELPPSALMDFGLRVGPEMPAGPVEAELLLGNDGIARAIRLVYSDRQDLR